MKVICISAKARHGKDTAAAMMAEYLEEKGNKVLITHFADLLKYICTKFFGWNGDKDEKGRTLLQYVGTDKIGKQRPDFWVNFIIDILKLFENEWDFVIIPDCRYPIEYEAMRNIFDTTLIRVERSNFDNGLTETQKKHPSEVDMDNYNFPYTIFNNNGLDVLKDKVETFVDQILLSK